MTFTQLFIFIILDGASTVFLRRFIVFRKFAGWPVFGAAIHASIMIAVYLQFTTFDAEYQVTIDYGANFYRDLFASYGLCIGMIIFHLWAVPWNN